MHISNIKIDSVGRLELLLSEKLNDDESICFGERLESDIWDIHYREFFLKHNGDNVYSFDASVILPVFEYCNEKVLDLYILNRATFMVTQLGIDLEKGVVDSFRSETVLKVGKIGCHYYKNGSGRLSVKTRFAPVSGFETSMLVGNDEISFKISSPIDRAVWMFARKSVSDATMRYDKFYIPTVKARGSDAEFVLEKKGFLGELLQGGAERWELVAKVNGLFFKARSLSGIESDIFEVSDAVLARVKASNGGSVTVETFENANKSQKKIKVAVIGTCFTRQAFNSKDFFNPDYKRFYECGLTAYHFSIPSMLSSPMTVDKNLLKGEFQSDLDAHGESHFKKDFIDKLRVYAPDYLIVENYVHISAALLTTEGGSYIDENYYLVNTPAFKELKVKERIRAESEKHFEIYKAALVSFKEKITGVIPEERIVLVRTHPALRKLEDGEIKIWESSQAIMYRRHIWERYDSYFISVFPRARVIDMRDEKYISEKSAHLKFAPSHFGSVYYKDLLNHFNKISLQDLLKSGGR